MPFASHPVHRVAAAEGIRPSGRWPHTIPAVPQLLTVQCARHPPDTRPPSGTCAMGSRECVAVWYGGGGGGGGGRRGGGVWKFGGARGGGGGGRPVGCGGGRGGRGGGGGAARGLWGGGGGGGVALPTT